MSKKKPKDRPGNKLMDQKFINSHWRRLVGEKIASGEISPEDDTVEFRDIEIPLSRPPRTSRLDAHLAGRFSNLSRSYFQQMIRDGEVRVNGRRVKPSYSLKTKDIITLRLPEMPDRVIESEPIPLDIIHDDDDIIVLNKQPGIIIHPGRGNQRGTLANGVMHHILGGRPNTDNINPGVVHRLDKNTTGVIILARSPYALVHLSRQFMKRRIGKTYLAVVGPPLKHKRGLIEKPIGYDPRDRQRMTCRSDGAQMKQALTEYEIIEDMPGCSVVAVTLHTGRTHQIRAHFEAIGHPVVGDPIYNRQLPATGLSASGGKGCVPGPLGPESGGLNSLIGRQALHAWKLTITHPTTKKKITFTAPIPADIQTLLTALRDGTHPPSRSEGMCP